MNTPEPASTTNRPPDLPPLTVDLLARLQPDPEWGGWIVTTTPTHTVRVLRMFVNDRIIITPNGSRFIYDNYWCYPQGGAAILAALAWDPRTQDEPFGWIKSADGRYGDPGIGQRGVDGKLRG